MEWTSSMAMDGYGKASAEGEEADDAEEDFYGLNANKNGTNSNMNTLPGANETSANDQPNMKKTTEMMVPDKVVESGNQPTTRHAEQQRAENERIAAKLRAKLLANRQNTPIKGTSRSNTPAKVVAAPLEEPNSDPTQDNHQLEQSEPSSDIFGLESLLAEGKAAAEAKLKETIETVPEQSTPSADEEPTLPARGIPGSEQNKSTVQKIVDDSANQTNPSEWATKLTDVYYADLPMWLDVTGYHDVEYRNSKLRTYKERKALEAEAARIAERLEKLRQAEQAKIATLRSSVAPKMNATARPPPPLPGSMPDQASLYYVPASSTATPAATANGVKRSHSPEPVVFEKSARRREGPTDFRIRGADRSTEEHPLSTRRARGPAPSGLERRVSYPEVRRNSVGNQDPFSIRNAESRDPSLERRQTFYKRDTVAGAPASANIRDGKHDRGQYVPYDAGRDYDQRGRLSYNDLNRPSAGSGYRGSPQHRRGSAGLDLGKGGQSPYYPYR